MPARTQSDPKSVHLRSNPLSLLLAESTQDDFFIQLIIQSPAQVQPVFVLTSQPTFERSLAARLVIPWSAQDIPYNLVISTI